MTTSFPLVLPVSRWLSVSLVLAAGGLAYGQAQKAPNQPKLPALVAPVEPSALQVAPGFNVELLYTVPRESQGSWVAMTMDPQGRMIVADQYGDLYRLKLPKVGETGGSKIEPLETGLRGAQGLLYAMGSLYVNINEHLPAGVAGLWRLKDLDGEGKFDRPELLRESRGRGEHGPHAIVLGPDGKSLYLANGNHTDLPFRMEKSRAVAWGEDHLLPRMWDARGHAKGKLAPGGYVVRTDADAKVMELFSLGFRNQYDIAFDQNGELFTFDSDMEWDIGSPWYLPTRINHIVDGSDYGWRSGAGRWPAYYADSLPAVVDIGPGSPTGVVFGTGAKFPAKYQRAFYAADWTYGTLYAIHLTPDGATFSGKVEEFVAGKPLPLTDLVINPNDGAMYFATGGRRTQSALYRVTYTGREATAPVKALPPTPEALQRKKLETFHADGLGAEVVNDVWPFLSNSDRFLRFSARVALEKQPVSRWSKRAFSEKNPVAAIEALIGLARVGDKSLQPQIIEALGRFEYATLPASAQLPWLRAWQLAFTRLGKPEAPVRTRLISKLDPLFPTKDAFANRELADILIYLGSPTIVGKMVPLLNVAEPEAEEVNAALIARNDNYAKAVNETKATRPDRQQMAYAYSLRNATDGWTKALRVQYFSWFARTHAWRGGASFVGFIANIRTESLANVADLAERASLANLSAPPPPSFPIPTVTPKGPGRAYTVADAERLADGIKKGRDFERGKAMFTATACIVCHRFGIEGGGIGPDLTGSGNRYTVRDLLENIVDPSAVISDQYGSEQIDLADGSVLVGRIVGEDQGQVQLMTNPFTPDEKTTVKSSDIKARKPFGTSMMPSGLINSLNEDEVKDLLAYLLSGGNPNDSRFKK